MTPPSTGQLSILLIIVKLAEYGVRGDLLEACPVTNNLPHKGSAQKVPNSLPSEGSGR